MLASPFISCLGMCLPQQPDTSSGVQTPPITCLPSQPSCPLWDKRFEECAMLNAAIATRWTPHKGMCCVGSALAGMDV